MARLVCHANLLKNLPIYSKSWPLCDLSAPDNGKHLVLQCPTTEQKRREMFCELEQNSVSLGARLFDNAENILPLLLGKFKSNMTLEQMEGLWTLAGSYMYIHEMYRENLKLKLWI